MLDPAKAFGFVVPLVLWIFAELFPESKSSSETDIKNPRAMHPHDQALAQTLFKRADGNFVRFLNEHDFGATWHRAKTVPAFDLEDFLNDPNSVFEDQELQNLLWEVKSSNDEFLHNICHFGGPIRGERDFCDMIPFAEKDSGLRSERSKARIKQTNERADKLARTLTELFASLRVRGVSLIREDVPPTQRWQPLDAPRDPHAFVDE